MPEQKEFGFDREKYPQSEAFDRGYTTRRSVLGPDYVDGSVRRGETEAFTHDLQRIVNEFVWGSVWARDGLGLRERSIVVLTILAFRSQEDELCLHIEGALNNGLTLIELREIFLQIAAYAGMPACLVAFKCARKVARDRNLDLTDLGD
ncbi:MAG: carboxymuconolactone decarboxylase family protein [Pseudomonadota bacterium]